MLLASTSCWINSLAAGDFRGCVTVKWHMNVTSWYYCKYNFLLSCISFHLNTHMLQNLLFRFQSGFSSTSAVVFSFLFGHSCSVIWCVGQNEEWTTWVRSVDPMPDGRLLGVPLTPDISLSSLLHAPSAPPVTVVNRWPVAEINLPSKSSG